MPRSELRGVRELSKKLQRLGPAAGGKALRSATLQATLPIVKRARALIPVRDDERLAKTYKGRRVAPGFALRNIARKSFLSRDKSKAFALVGVKPEAFYAVQFVERGTSTQPAQPWLRPAYRQTRGAVLERLKKRLRATIEREAKRAG